MSLLALVCPGFHREELTAGFIGGLTIARDRLLVVPTAEILPVSGPGIMRFLQQSVPARTPIFFISFSGGAVGAIAAAREWQAHSGTVAAFVALDAWGVPLGGNFPIHRLSHDYFTHWSSCGWGNKDEAFYAEPAVEHLALWESPQTAWGWRERRGLRSRCTAAELIDDLWREHC